MTRRGAIQLSVERRIRAPSQRLWEIVSDHEGMPSWFPSREVVRRRPGAPDANGVGAIRVVRSLGLAVEERVTAFKPRERLEYALTEGAPFSEYRGELTLAPCDDGTLVRWSVRLRPLIPGSGWILARVVARQLRRGLEGLAQLAEPS